jgi:hypothetical protein
MDDPLNKEAIVRAVQDRIPNLFAIYVFGSPRAMHELKAILASLWWPLCRSIALMGTGGRSG